MKTKIRMKRNWIEDDDKTDFWKKKIVWRLQDEKTSVTGGSWGKEDSTIRNADRDTNCKLEMKSRLWRARIKGVVILYHNADMIQFASQQVNGHWCCNRLVTGTFQAFSHHSDPSELEFYPHSPKGNSARDFHNIDWASAYDQSKHDRNKRR